METAGHHELPQQFIDDHKRQRVVPGVARFAHEHGIAQVTTAQILGEARMARGTFYALFENKNGGVQFAFGRAFEHTFGPVRVAGEGTEPWLERVGAVLDALFTAAIEEPLLAELCLVHSLSAPALAEQRDLEAGVETFAEAIQGGREAGRETLGASYLDPAPQTEQFLARGVVAITAMRIRQGMVDELPSHRDELAQLISTPFLGLERGPRTGRRLKAA